MKHWGVILINRVIVIFLLRVQSVALLTQHRVLPLAMVMLFLPFKPQIVFVVIRTANMVVLPIPIVPTV